MLLIEHRLSLKFHLREGDDTSEFSYRLAAKRLGYETDRLERAPYADEMLDLSQDAKINNAAQGD